MTAPSVDITKIDFQTGSVGPDPDGVLAIISSAGSGPFNTPSGYTVDSQAFTDYGPSPLVEKVSYTLAASGKPVIPIRATTATAAAYGAITETNPGTSTITAGAAVPVDSYPVTVKFLTGGTVGVAGITYQYSLDGVNVSAVQSLGAANTLTIPNFAQGGSPGVSFALGAGTILATQSFTCQTTAAQITDADLPASLEALRVTSLPWEAVLVGGPADAGTPGLVDVWLTGLEKVGKFRVGILNTRLKSAGESETTFATAMTTLVATMAPSIRLCVGTDGGDVTSTLTGLTLPRPTSLALAADAMAIPIGQDPAYVGDGPIPGYVIVDAKGNPKYHNEELYPNLDQLLLSTLRSVNTQKGVYITNGRVFSTVGSDYVFLPHVRTMNRGCEVAYQVLTTQLGKGVGKKPKDPVTGGVYILESDAADIEGLVNTAVELPLKGQVSAFKFSLSRTDDISANSGAVISGSLAIVALAYIKGIKVIAAFAKSISVSL